MRVSVALMLVVGTSMWVVTPLAWLFIGSMIKTETDNLGLAMAVMFIGSIATIVALVKALGMLNDTYYDEWERLNDVPLMTSPLEPMLVFSAVLALTIFGFWFIIFAGPTPSVVSSSG